MSKAGKITTKISKYQNTETLGIAKPASKVITKSYPVWRTCCVKAGVQWNSNKKEARYKHKKRYPGCPYLEKKAWLKEKLDCGYTDPVKRKKFLKKRRQKRHRRIKRQLKILKKSPNPTEEVGATERLTLRLSKYWKPSMMLI